jgi:phosphohistidine swiveling domain-containing protein/membrane-associated phospholipid phosphatase
VITDLTQGGLRRGEVLVAHTTDAAWAPLFLTAGAIVVEEGGPLCHAAIVARELGVPAVVNVPGVVELVRAAGEVDLVVDGDTGDLVVHRAGDPDQSWGPGAMPSRRSPGTLDRTDTRLGIFVTGLIGAGAVFSAVVAATEAVGSVRGQRRLAAHAAPIADMYAAGVVEGFDTVAKTPIGLRERRTFAALAVIAFALAALVGGHAIGEWDGRGDIGTVLAVTAQLAGAATVAWWGATVAQAWRQWPAVRPTLRRVLAARPVRRPDVVTTFGRRHWNVIVGLGTFFVILGLVNRFVPEPLQRIDDWLYDEVLDAGSANERWGPELFNWFGRPAFVIPFAFLIAVMTLRNRRLALAFPLAVTVGGLVNLTCAWLVPRLRPASGIHAGKSDSFPAGHPIMIVLLLGVLPLAVGALTRSTRAQQVARVVCTATLGLALIDTVRKGSHWPTDLLAGTMLGLLLTVAVHGYVRQGAHTSQVPP